MQFVRRFWEAAAALDPAAAHLDQGRQYPLCQPGPLHALFAEAGLEQVDVVPIEIATVFRDFDDYWSPFLAGEGVAPRYLAGLAADHRAALRDRLRHDLPAGRGGAISLRARAWAARGVAGPHPPAPSPER
jgi:hypothetical protein